MERIVFLDRATLQVPMRRPAFAHQWQEYAATPPEAVVSHLQDATFAITNKVKLRREQLEKLTDLRMIAVAATGFDGVDIAYCRKRGVRVANVPGYSRGSVPEHVIAMILALRRHFPDYVSAVRRGAWQQAVHFALMDFPIDDIAGSTLGIIGYGDLGQRVEKLAQAFGMEVLIADHKASNAVRPGRTAFEETLQRSDVVSLHCPLNEATRGLIGARELSGMKSSALLINTARGGIVDESALADALKERRIAGAGVDVLTEEPPRRGNPLLDPTLPNLIVTPHIAWASRQAQTVLAEAIVKNLESFAAGKPMNLVA